MINGCSPYLEPTAVVDSQHPIVIEFVESHTSASDTPAQRAAQLYRAVRDVIRYDFYRVDITVDGLRASTTIRHGYGWCVPKAALLAACCRASGIPAKLGFADVRNHISTERLRRYMKSDIFRWHGYTSIYLDGRWLKATPAFNVELCHKFRLLPLEFDGRNDALLHPFDQAGNRHMEYIRFIGEYADVPVEDIRATFAREYPFYAELAREVDFDEDVCRESST